MKLKYILAFYFVVLAILTGCQKDDPQIEGESKRTTLVYMIANNNLDDIGYKNIDNMIAGAAGSTLDDGHLVIYHASAWRNPQLIEIKKNSKGIITKHIIKDYEEQNSVDPVVMYDVIDETIQRFPADSYGLILWSHGSSWLPSKRPIEQRSFGDDRGRTMEIYELAKALPDHVFEFLMFDACSMGSIECVYELKDKADYIMASPSEVMAIGYPYDKMIPLFFATPLNLDKVAKSFYDFYATYEHPYGNIAVTKTSELDELAVICKEIIETAGMEKIYALQTDQIQMLSTLYPHPTRLFDFGQSIKNIAKAEQFIRFQAQLDKVVVSKYNTPKSYAARLANTFDINHFSGLSMYIPQDESQDLINLNAWYKRLNWSKATGL